MIMTTVYDVIYHMVRVVKMVRASHGELESLGQRRCNAQPTCSLDIQSNTHHKRRGGKGVKLSTMGIVPVF